MMLTARDEEESELQGLDAGADDYLTNPLPGNGSWQGSRCCSNAQNNILKDNQIVSALPEISLIAESSHSMAF